MKVLKTVGGCEGGRTTGFAGRSWKYTIRMKRERRIRFMGVKIVSLFTEGLVRDRKGGVVGGLHWWLGVCGFLGAYQLNS